MLHFLSGDILAFDAYKPKETSQGVVIQIAVLTFFLIIVSRRHASLSRFY